MRNIVPNLPELEMSLHRSFNKIPFCSYLFTQVSFKYQTRYKIETLTYFELWFSYMKSQLFFNFPKNDPYFLFVENKIVAVIICNFQPIKIIFFNIIVLLISILQYRN